MNERIKQFERESHLDVYSLGLDKAKWESRLEAYTLLIVQECVGVVEGGRFLHDQAPTALFAKECSSAIKQHFGVKE
jgi:hypothetical protein